MQKHPPSLNEEMAEIDSALWHGVDEKDRAAAPQGDILAIYKHYVSMADNISERRSKANIYFLSVNTAVLTLFGAIQKIDSDTARELANPFLIAGILLCVVWILLLRSYRNLNSAKFKVIGLIERSLPISPWWAAEWKALGEGKDWRKYIPLSLVETFVPILFAIGFIILI